MTTRSARARTISRGIRGRLGKVAAIAILALAHGPAEAQTRTLLGTHGWAVYGTDYSHARDRAVPGDSVLLVAPRAAPGEPWSSGATVAIPSEIAAGEPVTMVFWARAARTTRLDIALQGPAPTYARFASTTISLGTRWQRVILRGTAPARFAANSQALSVPLGQARTQVALGPVALLRGAADDKAIARAFAGFHPPEVATDVRIAVEPSVTLAGTLHLPATHGRARVPLVVLIQGHGPNRRGGFPEIVRRLTAHGIAALEYDKRGIGQSTGIYREDVERLTADAAAAVAAMRRRRDIDPRRIALVGHSQGGVIAPAVAAADPRIAGIVMLAGSVGDGLPYLRRAILNQMIVAGRPAAPSATAIDAAITLLQARIDGKDAETIARLRTTVVDRFEAAGFRRPEAEAALAMIDTEETRRATRLRSASDLRALRMPVLAVFASKDPLVVAADEAPEARKALAQNPRGTVVVLEGLSHWFQEGAVTGNQEEVATLGPNAGSPRLVALVGDWLEALLNR
ncbi:alpha/beta hydrolase [Sphingomonas sp. R1]|uniref:alpha/beta hydrolase n=1 Tax=Sphingomonas sp. R1 TaxID=399176 RepID=UPI00222491C9|nr:alpha/beta hydrolase [Sphingomonas sp. R1]UYY77066.1 alpha/beta hydrolase [Sphingomonas sp. R1]